MIREKHFKKDVKYYYNDYEENVCALYIKIYNSPNEIASAIVGWDFWIDSVRVHKETVDELVDFLKKLPCEHRILVFCHKIKKIEQFLKPYFECEEFETDKGLVSVLLDNKIELREIKFILSDDWKDFSDKEVPIEQLFDCAQLYWKSFVSKKIVEGKLPCTLAQYVRQQMKARMTAEDRELVKKLYPRTPKGYKDMKKKLLIGGYCDKGNPFDVTHEMCTIGHVDYKSSYIARMLTEYFPMSSWSFTPLSELKKALEEKCCIIHAKYYNIEAKKVRFLMGKRAIESQGMRCDMYDRIESADYIELHLTELDFELIRMCYSFASVDIIDLLTADRGQLPKYVRSVAEEFFLEKETLPRGTIEREIAKLKTEFVYGATLKGNYGIDLDTCTQKQWEYHRKQQAFSPYWGVWTLAHARYALISTIVLMGGDFLYADTDSIFYKNPIYHVQLIRKYNEIQQNKIRLYCIDNNLPFEPFKHLGSFVYEDGATENHFTLQLFRSPGPKRHIEWGEECGLKCTVAGWAQQYDIGLDEKVSAWEVLLREHYKTLKEKYPKEKDITLWEQVFDLFDDYTKVIDSRERTYYIDEPCDVEYNGKTYHSDSFAWTRRTKEVCDSLQRLKEFAEFLEKDKKHAVEDLGKENI